MSTEPGREKWFALQVRARWEKSTTSILSAKGYQTLLPTFESKRRRGVRMRVVNAPLFPGYAFCRLDISKRLPVLVTPGVIAVVGRGRIPVPLEEADISIVRSLADSGVPAEPWPYLEIGQRVRINNTALSGIEGILISFRGAGRIVLSVSLLRRSVALEIDRAQVSSIESGRHTVSGSLVPRTVLAQAVI